MIASSHVTESPAGPGQHADPSRSPRAYKRPTAVTGSSSRLTGEEVASFVESAASGDERAWDALVREFGTMIWSVARAHRLHDAAAADVAQATWLRLFEHLGKLREPAHVGAWLATTARRECLRVLRDAQRQVLYGNEIPEDESPECEPPLGTRLILTERDGALWSAFARLRPSDQALLRLLMADPRPAYEEIAAALAIPVGSIGPTRARALERLRRELEREDALALMTA